MSAEVTVPAWLISIFASLFVSLLVVWGGISAAKATLEVRLKRAEDDIKELWEQKVSHIEFRQVIDMLAEIKQTLKDHIDKGD